MKNKGKRAFALFLALAMCLGLLQTMAFATEGEGLELIDAITNALSLDASEPADEPAGEPAAEGESAAADGSDSHDHVWSAWDVKELSPTCVDSGVRNEFRYCEVPGCLAFEANTFDLLPNGKHIYENGRCIYCNETDPNLDSEEPEPEEHVHEPNGESVTEITKEATCRENGIETTYQICAFCNEKCYPKDVEIIASPEYHQWYWVHQATASKAPTCIDDGVDVYFQRCAVCEVQGPETKAEAAPATKKHIYGEDHRCIYCHAEDPLFAASGTCTHEWLEWIDLPNGAFQAPTCGKAGFTTQWRGCTLCNAEETRELPISATGDHQWKEWRKLATATHQAATCVAAGYEIQYRSCPVCNDWETRSVTIPAKGHIYENGKCIACGDWDETFSMIGARMTITSVSLLEGVEIGNTASWNVTIANTGDTDIRAKLNTPGDPNLDVYLNGASLVTNRQYINLKPGETGTLLVTYHVTEGTPGDVVYVPLTFADDNSKDEASFSVRYTVVETKPVEPEPVRPDPVRPDPVRPDPVEPDPEPAPAPDPTPVTPAQPDPAPAVQTPAVQAPAAQAPATPAPAAPAPAPAAAVPAAAAFVAAPAPAAVETLDEDDTPTAGPEDEEEDEEVDEPETPTAAPEEELDDPATPMAAPEEDLDEGETPLAAPGRPAWALLNLVLTLCTILASALLLLDPTGREFKTRSGILRLVSLVPALGALVAFLLTEDLRLPMTFVDRWTLLMVLIALVQLTVCIAAKKLQGSADDNSGRPTAARA